MAICEKCATLSFDYIMTTLAAFPCCLRNYTLIHSIGANAILSHIVEMPIKEIKPRLVQKIPMRLLLISQDGTLCETYEY